jgi:hypothetical protein
MGIKSFDYGHLEDPVPASIYYDAMYEQCWGDRKEDPCATLTDGRYRPPLEFRSTIWKSLLGDYAHCSRPGLVDPPIALIRLEPDENGQAVPPLPSIPTLTSIDYQKDPQNGPQRGSQHNALETLARPEHRSDSPWPMPTSSVQNHGRPSRENGYHR